MKVSRKAQGGASVAWGQGLKLQAVGSQTNFRENAAAAVAAADNRFTPSSLGG